MEEDKEERDHWYNVMRTLLHYEDFFNLELDRRQRHLNKLPQKYADLLPDITFDKINALHQAAVINQDFC